jgi:hypothetical protein
MMVTRTADLAREAGAMQRKNDLTRDFLAHQAKALSELEKQQVERTLTAQQVVIHRNKHGNGRQEYPEADKEKNDYSEEIGEDYLEFPSEGQSTIDIKI